MPKLLDTIIRLVPAAVFKADDGIIAAIRPTEKESDNANAKIQPCQALTYPRVLVLYTPKALTLAGSTTVLTDQVNLSITQFNSCIYNSGITSDAVLVLAEIAPIQLVTRLTFPTH